MFLKTFVILPLLFASLNTPSNSSCVVKTHKTTTVCKNKQKKTVSTTTLPTISDQVNVHTNIFYRLNQNVLERRSSSGYYFSNDSRSQSSFHPIRVKAYNQIKSLNKSSGHSNVQFIWDIRPEFPIDIQSYLVYQTKNAAEVFNNIFTNKIYVNTLLATEKDVDYSPVRTSYFTDTYYQLQRFQSTNFNNQLAWITGGGGYWNSQAKLFFGTPTTAATERYVSNWIQIPAHEFFHIVQHYLFSGRINEGRSNFNVVVPHHFREGSAVFIGYSVDTPNLGWYSDAMDQRFSLIWSNNNTLSVPKTQDDIINLLLFTENSADQFAFDLAYPLGAFFWEWFVATYGYEQFISLIKDMPNHSSFDDTIKSNYGISKVDLYRLSSAYMLEAINKIIN